MTTLETIGPRPAAPARRAWSGLDRMPHWPYVMILTLIWYIQYAVISLAYPPSFFAASNDFISLALHLQNPDNWGTPLRNDTTAQFRGVGYSFYLLAVSFGSLNIGLIVTANYLLTLLSYMLSYFLFARAFNRIAAVLFVAVLALTFAPLAFAPTILSEHLIISLLMVLAPLCILSVMRKETSWRISTAATLVALTFVKSIFAPMLALYIAFWTVEWILAGFRRTARRHAPLVAGSLVALALVAPVNSLFVSNYNSGAYIFGLANSLVFGADTAADDLDALYAPLFDRGLLDDASALETWGYVVGKAEENGAVDPALKSATATDVRRLLFNKPTLETYWQIKWKILRGIEDEREANALAKTFYFGFIANYPTTFAANIVESWLNFSLGRSRDFTYRLDDESIFREEQGLRVYRTNPKASKRFLKGWKAQGVVVEQFRGRSAPLVQIDAKKLIAGSVQSLFAVNFVLAALWIAATALSLVVFRMRRRPIDEKWIRTAAAAFLLQASFFGIGLGTVLFHPPLGRYFLPLFPIVAAGSLMSMLSIGATVRRVAALRTR